MEKVVAAPSESTSFRSNLAGKYLTFALANEGYGVPVLKVHEIITMLHITMVPSNASLRQRRHQSSRQG
jgi:chemotaxis signal transduction protein